jgi:hypothetical protein
MTVRLYCDEDSIQHSLVLALRKRGVDILTALEAEMLWENQTIDSWYTRRRKGGRSTLSTSAISVAFTRSGYRNRGHMRALSWRSNSNTPLASK